MKGVWGMSIVNKHPDGVNPLAISLIASDCITASGVAHRALGENGRNDVLLKYMEDALQKHHISPDALQRYIFKWDRNDKLYIREANGNCFLISKNGYFYEKVESTNELPFLKIANILGLYFERDNNLWKLQSNNPRIVVG